MNRLVWWWMYEIVLKKMYKKLYWQHCGVCVCYQVNLVFLESNFFIKLFYGAGHFYIN